MHTRSGMALLEVIVGITILTIAGISASVWMHQIMMTVEHVHQRTDEIREADHYLDIIALWPREDLDRHLGHRREGPWLVRVDRPVPTVYDVAIADSTGARVILSTSLYRPEIPHDVP